MSSFVNRVADFRALEIKTRARKQTNGVIFITGVSGVGKSAFTNKYVEDQMGKPIIFRKKFSTHGSYSEGFFIQQLAILIDDYSKDNPELISFSKFIATDVKKVGEIIFKYFLNINSIVDSIQSYSLNDKVIHAIQSYLKRIFNDHKIVVVIEGIENIDEVSMTTLQEIITSTRDNLFIFEYTLTDDLDKKYYKLWDQLSSCVTASVRHQLEPLNIEECKKLCKVTTLIDSEMEETFKNVYSHSKGNLYAILHYDPMIDKPDTYKSLSYDTTEYQVKKLTIEQQYVIITIELYDGEIDRRLFDDLMAMSNRMQHVLIPDVLCVLEQSKFIRISDRSLILHDSLVKKIRSDDSLEMLRQEVYKDIVILFDTLKEETKEEYVTNHLTMREILIKEIGLHQQFDCLQLYYCMDEIIEYNKKMISIDVIRTYVVALSGVREKFYKRNMRDEVDKFIISEGYKLGMLDHIKDVLMTCNLDQKITDLYLYQLGTHFGNIDETEHLATYYLTLPEVDIRYKFFFKLARQIRMLSYEEKMVAVRYSQLILEQCDENSSPEFGIFLRNYATRVENKDAIPLIERAILLLRNAKKNSAVGHTLLTLVSRYAYTGAFNKATKSLAEAENILVGTNFRTYYLLNNKAVLSMFKGDYSRKTEKQLQDSLAMVQLEFDKIIILFNIVVYYSVKGLKEKVGYYLSLLESLEFTKYNNFESYIRIYYAKLLDALVLENIELAMYIVNEIDTLKEKHKVSVRVEICELLKEYNFELTHLKKYIDCIEPRFITYWSFDIPEEILD